MNSRKNLAAKVMGAMAIAALVGASAFAETRHSDATDGDHNRVDRSSRHERSDRSGSQNQTRERRDAATTAPQTFERRDSSRNSGTWNRNETRNNNGTWDRSETRNRNESRNNNGTWNRNETRNNGTWNRNETRNNGTYDHRSQADSYRNNRGYDRSQTYRNNRPYYDNRGRRSDFVQGRIRRYAHERGGYRIWVDGGRFPIWIPEARIGLFPRLRVGLSLRFGGYYDPLGYLEAYDYYNDGYGDGAYSSGLLRGVVETVDYRRDTLVLRDDASGNFVTTVIRDRRLETLRPGDYVEIAGDWTRSGIFEGLRLEDVQGGRY
jgi:hypothetical protein